MTRRLKLVALILLGLALNAQQPQPTYPTMAPIQNAGAINNPAFDANSYVEGAALSDAGELAYVMHSADSGNDRTALFTTKRFVARDGDVVDGKTIVRIWPSSLAINARARVAFEADFKEGSWTARGVFLDNHFITAIKSEGAPGDFALTPDGRVNLKPGIAIAPPPAPKPVVPTVKGKKAQASACPDVVAKWEPPGALRKIWDRGRDTVKKTTGADGGSIDDATKKGKEVACAPDPNNPTPTK